MIQNPHSLLFSFNNKQINTECTGQLFPNGKGKIVVGYRGIGKSTLARSGKGRYIDLESSSFSVRDGWEKIYCKIAEHLAEQGYTVFVSSHAEVRKILKESKCKVVAVVPHPDLGELWIEKLKKRYFDTEEEKDRRAWLNAKERFAENVKEIMDDFHESKVIVLKDMNYQLEDCV